MFKKEVLLPVLLHLLFGVGVLLPLPLLVLLVPSFSAHHNVWEYKFVAAKYTLLKNARIAKI